MIRDKEGIYRFTEEEKVRVQKRREESLKIKDMIEKWYNIFSFFTPDIHRSTNKDYDLQGNIKDPDTTIIKYTLTSDRNGVLLDFIRADKEVQKSLLQFLQMRLAQAYPQGIFRIKMYVSPAQGTVNRVRLQVIFVEHKDRYVPVKGDPTSIVYEKEPESNMDISF